MRRVSCPAGGAGWRCGSAGCRHTARRPGRRRNAPIACSAACAVPSRSCCTTQACGAASLRTASMSGPSTITIRSNTGSQLASRWRSIDRPARRCSVFGNVDFIRVPRPAARIIAVACIPVPCFARRRGVAVATQQCQRLPFTIGAIHVSECNTVARTLLLDLDGTLVDTVPDIAAALNRLMDARWLPSSTRERSKRWSATASRCWSRAPSPPTTADPTPRRRRIRRGLRGACRGRKPAVSQCDAGAHRPGGRWLAPRPD